MKAIYCYVSVLAIALAAHNANCLGINGGIPCGVCTALVALTEQIIEINEQNATEIISGICNYLPPEFKPTCNFLIQVWFPTLIEKLLRKETADVICHSFGICRVDPGQKYCVAFPPVAEQMHQAVWRSRKLSSTPITLLHWSHLEKKSSICDVPGIDFICATLKRVFDQVLPAVDYDGDKFSNFPTLRGSSWRGADCNDFNESIYPGARPIHEDEMVDTNCNGIGGINFATGNSFEKEFCDGTDQYGIVYIGDSVGAHFFVPPQWITPKEINIEVFKHLPFILFNELDWPETSFATGYENITWPVINGYTDSLYLRLRQHNLCNHRDFQNIAVNGANSSSILDYLPSISRNKTKDKPVIAVYAMIGNDVCTRYSLSDMTTPKDFRRNVLETLNYLEKILPKNSHVILVGLVNGSFIYPAMAKRYYPLGELHKDLTYEKLYDWFNCMQMSFCYGWLNSNETIRRLTTERAVELTNVLKKIVSISKFESFQLHFVENPLSKVIKMWEKAGNKLWQMLDPVDSFHPVQKLQPYITEVIWQDLTELKILGKPNPNNEKIKQVFGDQGGYDSIEKK